MCKRKETQLNCKYLTLAAKLRRLVALDQRYVAALIGQREPRAARHQPAPHAQRTFAHLCVQLVLSFPRDGVPSSASSTDSCESEQA